MAEDRLVHEGPVKSPVQVERNFGQMRSRAMALQNRVTELEDALAALPITVGTGDPENVVVADTGALFLRTDGGAGTSLYVKEADDGLDTGWVGK